MQLWMPSTAAALPACGAVELKMLLEALSEGLAPCSEAARRCGLKRA